MRVECKVDEISIDGKLTITTNKSYIVVDKDDLSI